MIELWNKEQILAEMPDEKFWRIWSLVSGRTTMGHDVVGEDVEGWKVLVKEVVPTESVTLVLELSDKNLILRVIADASGIRERTQVFRRDRRVIVTDYVTADKL